MHFSLLLLTGRIEPISFPFPCPMLPFGLELSCLDGILGISALQASLLLLLMQFLTEFWTKLTCLIPPVVVEKFVQLLFVVLLLVVKAGSHSCLRFLLLKYLHFSLACVLGFLCSDVCMQNIWVNPCAEHVRRRFSLFFPVDQTAMFMCHEGCWI